MRRSHDHVMCGQRFERVFENRTRQVWAVAVEGNDASLAFVMRASAKCANTEVRPAARPSPFCATTLHLQLPANCASSFTSESGHMIATSTSPNFNDRASASVSSRRQQ